MVRGGLATVRMLEGTRGEEHRQPGPHPRRGQRLVPWATLRDGGHRGREEPGTEVGDNLYKINSRIAIISILRFIFKVPYVLYYSLNKQ